MSQADTGLTGLRYLSGGCFTGRTDTRHKTRRIDSYELIVLRTGHLPFFEDKQHYDLLPHQYLLLEPQREHGSSEDYPADVSFYWLHFSLPPQAQTTLKHGHFMRSAIAINLCSRILDEQERKDAPQRSCDLLMQLLLLECHVVQDQGLHDPHGLVDSATAFISSQFQQRISTSDVAQHCQCNPDHLGRLFKSRLKITISQAILNQRLQHARALLRDSDMPIDKVATASGFSEAHYFRRCFKQDSGLSPTQWRSLHCRRYYN